METKDCIRKLVKAKNSWEALKKAKKEMIEFGWNMDKWEPEEIIPYSNNNYVVKFFA